MEYWSVLHSHGVQNSQELVTILLSEVANKKNVAEQLRGRKVAFVGLANLSCKALMFPERQSRFVILLNQTGTLAEWAVSLGHEIAHTFGYSRYYPIKKQWREHPEEECFCDLFSDAWLAVNNNRRDCEHLLRTLSPEYPALLIQ